MRVPLLVATSCKLGCRGGFASLDNPLARLARRQEEQVTHRLPHLEGPQAKLLAERQLAAQGLELHFRYMATKLNDCASKIADMNLIISSYGIRSVVAVVVHSMCERDSAPKHVSLHIGQKTRGNQHVLTNRFVELCPRSTNCANAAAKQTTLQIDWRQQNTQLCQLTGGSTKHLCEHGSAQT